LREIDEKLYELDCLSCLTGASISEGSVFGTVIVLGHRRLPLAQFGPGANIGQVRKSRIHCVTPRHRKETVPQFRDAIVDLPLVFLGLGLLAGASACSSADRLPAKQGEIE
jgi:hypothetical protein